MLALTQPNDVDGLAVSQPLVDWVALDDYVNKQETAPISRTKKAWPTDAEVEAANSLVRLRTSLFSTPGAFFDPFASPSLFLRAPGRDTPRTYNIMDQAMTPNTDDRVSAVAYGPYDDDLMYNSRYPGIENSQQALCHEDQSTSSSDATSTPNRNDFDRPSSPSTTQRRRKVLRRWPPTGPVDTTILPPTRIFLPTISSQSSGLDRILHRQGIEMADLMRRACFWGREIGFAEERVGVEMYKSQSDDEYLIQGSRAEQDGSGKKELGQVAVWIRTMFDEP